MKNIIRKIGKLKNLGLLIIMTIISVNFSLLAQNGKFDTFEAAVSLDNGKAYLFKGDKYIKYDIKTDKTVSGYPKKIAGNWPGLFTSNIDAIFNLGNGKAYFFKGNEYIRYDIQNDKADSGYPKKIASGWSGVFSSNIDAVLNWGNGKAYFFKGNEYIRYDIKNDKADSGYPKKITGKLWPGVFSSNIDAVINWGNGKAYFFKGDSFIKYDIKADKADSGYPKKTTSGFDLTSSVDPTSIPENNVFTPTPEKNTPIATLNNNVKTSAVVGWDNGKAYFFKGDEYIRYNIKSNKPDAGYPKKIAGNWPGLFTSNIDAVVNKGNGKAYFFKGDEYIRYDIKSDKADSGYPKKIASGWSGVFSSNIDAVLNWGNGKAYFFKGNEYIRYDIKNDKADSGYPKKITGKLWPGVFSNNIDAVINWGNGKAYFFKGESFIKYDIKTDKADSGYPKKTAAGFDLTSSVDSTPTSAPSQQVLGNEIFNNSNISGVYNGAKIKTYFYVGQASIISSILNYHWNSGKGSQPGQIGLRDDRGSILGTWQSVGSDGMGGVKNANWTVYANIKLQPGLYQITDSEPSTWSQNSRSYGAGFSIVKAKK